MGAELFLTERRKEMTNRAVAFRSVATAPNELKQRAHVPVTGKRSAACQQFAYVAKLVVSGG